MVMDEMYLTQQLLPAYAAANRSASDCYLIHTLFEDEYIAWNGPNNHPLGSPEHEEYELSMRQHAEAKGLSYAHNGQLKLEFRTRPSITSARVFKSLDDLIVKYDGVIGREVE